MTEIAVLVSGGRHPVSGRSRRAANDARALELALQTAACCGAGLRVVHAGAPDAATLRGYLGMGVPELQVLEVAPGLDIAPVLAETLRDWRPALVLAGVRSETGWSSGCLPYVLAEYLDYPLVANIDSIVMNVTAGTAEMHQVCPRGRRRLLQARLPLVATVDPAAPAPRQSAYARERGGRLARLDWSGTAPPAATPGAARPARRRPRRLQKPVAGDSADARLRALTRSATGGGQVLEPSTPDEAALAIYHYLVEHGLVDAPRHSRPQGAAEPEN